MLGWLLGAAAAFYLLFLVITLVLRRMPAPIGENADLFVSARR